MYLFIYLDIYIYNFEIVLINFLKLFGIEWYICIINMDYFICLWLLVYFLWYFGKNVVWILIRY